MTTSPDLSSYRLVHVGLRSAAHRLAGAAAQLDPGDGPRVAALRRYWRGYAGEVLCHHTIEDATFFPALVRRVPVAGELIAETDVDHHRLDELMGSVTAALAAVPAPGAGARLVDALDQLAQLMDEHLDFEDAEVLPLFERHFAAPEYEQLDKAAVKALGLGRQAAFTVPFMVAVMDDDQRERALREAPLALRVLYRLTRRSHQRLCDAAFGTTAVAPTALVGGVK